MKVKTISFGAPLLGIFFLFITHFFLRNGVTIPLESHFLVTNLPNLPFNDSINSSYELLRSPIYYLISPIFSSPIYFYFFSLIFELIFILSLFFICLKITKNKFASFISICLFSGFTFAVLRDMGIGENWYPNVAFSLSNFAFNVRYIFSLICLFVFYLCFTNRLLTASIFVSLSFFVHPSNGISLFLIFSLFSLVQFINTKNYRVFAFILVSFLGALPSVFSFLFGPEVSLEFSTWYENILNNEMDDYSTLHQVKNNIFDLLIVFFLPLFICFILDKQTGTQTKVKEMFICIFLLWLIVFFIEIISLNFEPLRYVHQFMIISQLGTKLPNYSYITLILFFALFLDKCDINFIYKSYIKKIFYMAPIIIFLFSGFIFQEKFNHTYKYLTNLNKIPKDPSYEDYLLHLYHPSAFNQEKICASKLPPKLMPDMLIDPSERSYLDARDFWCLIKSIKLELEVGDGIIIPPYLRNIRDSLFENRVYFQEHHDGNLLLGGRNASDAVLTRMVNLLGDDYRGIFNERINFDNELMREKYLMLNLKQIKQLSDDFSFNYFLTEIKHELPLTIIFSDKNFVLYKISS